MLATDEPSLTLVACLGVDLHYPLQQRGVSLRIYLLDKKKGSVNLTTTICNQECSKLHSVHSGMQIQYK